MREVIASEIRAEAALIRQLAAEKVAIASAPSTVRELEQVANRLDELAWRLEITNPTPNAWGCYEPQCNDSTWDHDCPTPMDRRRQR